MRVPLEQPPHEESGWERQVAQFILSLLVLLCIPLVALAARAVWWLLCFGWALGGP